MKSTPVEDRGLGGDNWRIGNEKQPRLQDDVTTYIYLMQYLTRSMDVRFLKAPELAAQYENIFQIGVGRHDLAVGRTLLCPLLRNERREGVCFGMHGRQ